MKAFTQDITITGRVATISPEQKMFNVRCRSDEEFTIKVRPTTWFEVLNNLDGVNRDRSEEPEEAFSSGEERQIAKYIQPNRLLIVQGIYQEDDQAKGIEARHVILMHSSAASYVFEETHWWLRQISALTTRWLDDLFANRRSYKPDDFAEFYRTNLNIEGEPTNETTQECATLSRLIYGLSSAYLLTGNERFFLAAKAGVAYQRDTFRSLSHDGQYCFWDFGRRLEKNGYVKVVTSENSDDLGTIPLYEQIYALAGLTQFYRISLDWGVLEDIRRTINTFQDFYYDGESEECKAKGFPGHGGYFSHLDPASMRPDSAYLDNLPGTGAKNRSRKNWNSVGDHIPAYLVNLVLALDPEPRGTVDKRRQELLTVCRQILDETSKIVVDRFPDSSSKFVNERFHADWTPDHGWFWQQNRGIAGHNLKIAWNLTRVAFYFQSLEKRSRDKRQDQQADYYGGRSEESLALAGRLARDMAEVGTDMYRGGIFDAMERNPTNGQSVEFAWGNTKDFWQQEQGILAYLILHGAARGGGEYLELARESMAFWNAFFLDRDRQGIFFRTTESGRPIITGSYADKGGHSVSGYHAFELNYLAHMYIRSFVSPSTDPKIDDDFNLYFRVSPNCGQETLNVLPDFMPPGTLRITQIVVNGVDKTDELKPKAPDLFQIALVPGDREQEIMVKFRSMGT
jgi:mannose/cellobiose epimerase-like protein (N-acyl-D-glucosamine 2-epimerase family)